MYKALKGVTYIRPVRKLRVRIGPIDGNPIPCDDDVLIRNVASLWPLRVPLRELQASSIRLDPVSYEVLRQRPVPHGRAAGSEGIPDFVRGCAHLETVRDPLALVTISQTKASSFRTDYLHGDLFYVQIAFAAFSGHARAEAIQTSLGVGGVQAEGARFAAVAPHTFHVHLALAETLIAGSRLHPTVVTVAVTAAGRSARDTIAWVSFVTAYARLTTFTCCVISAILQKHIYFNALLNKGRIKLT